MTFRLLGIPVKVDPSLLLILVVLATSAHVDHRILLAFVIGGGVSVTAHELGHALAARASGAQGIGITLHGVGGLTRYRLTSPSRAKEILITAAGPAVGLMLGALVVLAQSAANPPAGSTSAAVYHQLRFVTIAWSVLNLLPVLPLDGGRLLEHLLPGTAQNRRRTAATVSVIVGAAACVYFYNHDQTYAEFAFGLLTAFGLVEAARGAAPGSQHRHTASCGVFGLMSEGRYAEADAKVRAGHTVEAPVGALVAVVERHDSLAEQALWRMYEEKPTDIMVRSCVTILRSHRADWAGVLAMVRSGPLKNGAVRSAIRGAYAAGAYNEGAAIGEAVLRTSEVSVFAFETARCWSAAGNQELALAALMRTVSLGWAPWPLIDDGPDFAPLRATESFRAWRMTFAAPALTGS